MAALDARHISAADARDRGGPTATLRDAPTTCAGQVETCGRRDALGAARSEKSRSPGFEKM
jgi:hypothetical protein